MKGCPSRPEKQGKPSEINPSYQPGVTWTDLKRCLPEFVVESIIEALPFFGQVDHRKDLVCDHRQQVRQPE